MAGKQRCFIDLGSDRVLKIFLFFFYLVEKFVAAGGIFQPLTGVVQSVTELGQLSLQRRRQVEDAAAAAGSFTGGAGGWRRSDRGNLVDRRLFVPQLSGNWWGRSRGDAGIPLQVFQQFFTFDDLFLLKRKRKEKKRNTLVTELPFE